MARPIALAWSVLTCGCAIDNPFFDLAPATSGATSGTDTGTGGGTHGGTGVAPTTGTSDATGVGEATAGPGSTAALTDGDTGVTSEPGTSTGAPLTGDTTGPETDDAGTLDTGAGDTTDGLLDPGEYTFVAAAHCVGVDQEITVTMSADECAALIAKEEAGAKGFNFCPELDASEFGHLAIDFHDGRSNSFVTTHLRFVVPPLGPGDVAVGGVLSLTAGCNAQYVADKPDNTFKPGIIFIDKCDQVPKFAGDKHPGMLSQLALDGVAEVGGAVAGALEPGERVEWKIDDAALAKLLAGGDVCLSVWSQFNVGNEVHYQASDAPHPPALSFVVQPG